MSRLDGVMSGLKTFRGPEVLASSTSQVMATDSIGSWGGVFELSIASKGTYNEQAVLMRRDPSGDWSELMSGGGHGDGWVTPWSPPVTGWKGGHIMAFGTTGTTVPVDDDDTLVPLRAVYGFASPLVESVRVEQQLEPARSVTPTPCGAWLALLLGPEPATLQPRGADGALLAEGHYVESARDWVAE